MKRIVRLNENDIRNLVMESLVMLSEDHLKVVDNIDSIIDFIGEQWQSPDDVWWIKIEARFKDFKNYNKRRSPSEPQRWWSRQSRRDGTHRENHVGYVIVRGYTKEAAQDSIRNAVVHLHPWAARIHGDNLVASNGNAEAIKDVCREFFARSYITINSRSMQQTVDRARKDKANPRYNPFPSREFHHRVGQSRTGIDRSNVNWTVQRPYGLIDCDIDDVNAQRRLEIYLAKHNVDILMKRQSHDGMHYVIPISQADGLNFNFLNSFSTNNRKGDPNVLFKPDANLIVYSAVG